MTEKAKIIITLMEDGRIVATGPLRNKVLAYGMLESARDIIKDINLTSVEIEGSADGTLDIMVEGMKVIN